MKVRKIFLSLFIAALVTSGITQATMTNSSIQEIERISVDELKRMMEQNTPVTIIDVRNESAFNASHIRGAINVPADQVGARIARIPTDREIVTYCA
jgi:predicted sulfurtransferase